MLNFWEKIMSDAELAQYIDHTLLKPEATEEDVKRVCREAVQYGFKTVCLYPKFMPLASELLKGAKTIPIAVVDFPRGDGSPKAKAEETAKAVKMGAKEIDMVINYHALKKKKYHEVLAGIQAVVEKAGEIPVKVILETCYLTDEEKIIASALSKAAGARFVKTSTGFGSGGATVEDVALMRRVVGEDMGVKASGGVRTADDVKKMLKAGANRIGASSSVAIVSGEKGKAGY
jgi:deoxyribose-phosphate aldolase